MPAVIKLPQIDVATLPFIAELASGANARICSAAHFASTYNFARSYPIKSAL